MTQKYYLAYKQDKWKPNLIQMFKVGFFNDRK